MHYGMFHILCFTKIYSSCLDFKINEKVVLYISHNVVLINVIIEIIAFSIIQLCKSRHMNRKALVADQINSLFVLC